jgi:DNA invertase Pin-like site-specific DNA recombinase
MVPFNSLLMIASAEDVTIAASRAAACSAIIFKEKRSGTKRNGRDPLDLALQVLSKGDTLVVTRLDRLGRSLRDLANIAHEIDVSGAHLRVVEQSVYTATSADRAFFGILAVFAQFETDVGRDRQAEGIARAKNAGVYTAGKPRIDREAILAQLRNGNGPASAARALGVSRMSVYRTMREVAAADRSPAPRFDKRAP